VPAPQHNSRPSQIPLPALQRSGIRKLEERFNRSTLRGRHAALHKPHERPCILQYAWAPYPPLPQTEQTLRVHSARLVARSGRPSHSSGPTTTGYDHRTACDLERPCGPRLDQLRRVRRGCLRLRRAGGCWRGCGGSRRGCAAQLCARGCGHGGLEAHGLLALRKA
jgi:hypothetical protein